MRTSQRLLLLTGLALSAAGCEASHAIYVHQATLGLDVSPASTGVGKLSLGFERETFALVPRQKDGTVDDGADAMTLTAISYVHAEGLGDVQFGHVIATGESAKAIAANPADVSAAAKAFFRRQHEASEARP